MLRRLLSIGLAGMLLLSFSACQDADDISSEPPPPFPVQVNGLTIPESVVSLSPALTEIVFELGMGARLVGRSEYCDYPPEVTDVRNVGSTAHPDLSQIVSLSPAVVLTQTPMAKKDIIALEDADIQVCILPAPGNLDDLKNTYEVLGTVFGGIDGAITGDTAYKPIGDAAEAAAAAQAGSFAYITSPQLTVATGDTFEGSVLSLFGTNVAEAGTGYSFAAEDILAAQPDTLLLASSVDQAAIQSDPVLSQLNALQTGRVLTIDSLSLERPTARLAALLDTIKTSVTSLDAPSAEETTAAQS